MSSYTCISCRVAFSDGEVQRAHYKTDWHRYNLKRKVADMPPVTADNFQERVLSQRAAAEEEAQLLAASSSEGCGVCGKRFASANARRNHLQSHKHQQEVRRAEEEARRAEEEARRAVQRMNEKNLEKGLDQDARNQALKEALQEQEEERRKEEKEKERREGGGGAARRQRVEVEKPPRMVWLEEQAKRQEEKEKEEEEGATAVEDEWEDVDSDMEEEEEEEEEEESMDQENPATSTSSCTSSCTSSSSLPGSLAVTDCLFCLHHSRSLLRNVSHMTRAHGFFLPDLSYLVDLRGLVRYLGEKVGAGNVCLWCNEKGRSFYSTEAVQSHMIDKSHCKLFTDGDAALEFADFYDFRSSYPDRRDGDDGDESLPDDRNLEYDDDTLELTLPSGARIGHRSLLRYYRQRFGFQKAVTLAHNQNAVGRVLKNYRALGWTGDAGCVSQRQRDMQYVQLLKSRWLLKTGMNHNTTRQKHFRAQVMF